MKIRKGDTVKIIKGKDRGKTGKVIQCFPQEGYVVVEGLNLRVKHLRARRGGEKGQKITYPAPLVHSNVMLVCPTCGKITRVGVKREGEARQRMCKKCKATFN